MSSDRRQSPLRKIVKVERIYPRYTFGKPGQHSVELTLECGHVAYRKASAKPKSNARCDYCFHRREGATGVSYRLKLIHQLP